MDRSDAIQIIRNGFTVLDIFDDTTWSVSVMLGQEEFKWDTPYCKSGDTPSLRRYAMIQVWFAKQELKENIVGKLSGDPYCSFVDFKAHCKCLMAILFLLGRNGLAAKVKRYLENVYGLRFDSITEGRGYRSN